MPARPSTLALRAASGDEGAFESLAARFEGKIRWITLRYYQPGAERADIRQRALLGLWKACRDWSPERGGAFPSFAVMCMEREVITSVKGATRGKHSPLNSAMPIDLSVPDAPDATIGDLIAEPGADPADRYEAKERLWMLLACMATMTPLERRSIWLTEACDASYERAAAELGATVKVIDNAVQRARRKLHMAMRDVTARCDICGDEIVSGTRCGSCSEEIAWARRFIAA